MDAIFEIFKARAEAVSAEVHHFPQKNEALDFILNYLNDTGVPICRSLMPCGPRVRSSKDLNRGKSPPACPA